MEFACYPSTVRIAKGEARRYACCKTDGLSFAGVRGEYECAQLLTGDGNARLYAADLNGPQGTLPKDAFEVFVQYYTANPKGSPCSDMYAPGEYPDALIPQPLALRAGLNAAAFWVTVRIGRDTAPGTYTGTFTLETDTGRADVPVCVTVYAACLPEGNHMPTSFGVWAGPIDEGAAYDEHLFETYIEFLFSYRLNPFWHFHELPDPDAYARAVKRYFRHPMLLRYGLPNRLSTPFIPKVEGFRPFILALARHSDAENNLLSRAFTYFYDEPEGNGMVAESEEAVLHYRAMLVRVADEIAADDTGAYDGLKTHADWRQSVVGLETLGTVLTDTPSALLADLTDIWCPPFASCDSQRKRTDARRFLAARGKHLWWYGCSGPHYPFPTYHLSDDLLSGRILSWMQRAMGVEGNLYWCAAGYREGAHSLYDDACTGSTWPIGEGVLCYPGRRFGSDAPMPSVRLMSVRDGMEEYELLRMLEQKYAGLREEYGLSFDPAQAVAAFVGRLHDQMQPLSARFPAARRDLLEKVSADDPTGFVLQDVRIIGNTAQLTFYVRRGAAVSVNGVRLQPEGGVRYRYDLPLQCGVNALAAEIEYAGRTYAVCEEIAGGVDAWAFMSYADIRGLLLPEGGSTVGPVLYPSGFGDVGSRYVSLRLQADETGYAHISVDLAAMAAASGIPSADCLSLHLFNRENRSLTMFAHAVCGDERFAVCGMELFADSPLSLRIPLAEIRRRTGKDVGRLTLSLRNTYPADVSGEMRLYIGNARYHFYKEV